MKVLVSLLFFLISTLSFSQTKITGKVVDEKKVPAKSVAVLLLSSKDSSLTKSAITNENGIFEISDVTNGKYLLFINALNYQKKYAFVNVNSSLIELEPIVLLPEVTTLNEVTVNAVKPFLEQRADKLIVNVENSATAAGATALEILQKVPGVMVMNEKITLTGKGTPAIYIDGRPSQYTDVAQVLRDMTASDISKIELITNPGARYDAAGGAVINFVLKRNANIGTNGSVSLSTGTGLYSTTKHLIDRNFNRLNPSFSINHRKGKVNLFGSYSYFTRNQFEYNEFSRIISGYNFLQTNYNPNEATSNSYRFGVDFFANKKNTFGFLIKGFERTGSGETQNKTNQLKISNNNIESSFETIIKSKNDRSNVSANFNWKHYFDTTGKDLNVDIDFSSFKINNNSNILNKLSNGTEYTNNQFVDNPVKFGALKVDYIHPFNANMKLELGGKSSIAKIDNYLTFLQKGIIDPTRSTNFIYQENINAAYGSFQNKIKKWDFMIGLRAEQTIAKGKDQNKELLNRNYTQLFPSTFVTYNVTKDIGFNLQYSRRVERPSFQQQNPFVVFLDSLTYTRGNPLLRPEILNSYKFAVNYKNQPFISVSYNKTSDVIFENAPKQDGNLTYTTVENLAAYENLTFELNLPIPLGKKFDGFIHNEFVLNKYKAEYLGDIYNRQKWNYLLFSQLTYKPADTWSIEANGYYMTAFLNEFINIQPMGALNFGIAKTLMDKKLRLSFNFNDVLYSQVTKGEIAYQAINVNFLQRAESRNIRFTVRYSFGNQKLKASRNRNTASDAEANRVKN